MELPLRALQHVSVKPAGPGATLWHRGVILDIEEGAGLLVALPDGVLGRRVSELEAERESPREVVLEVASPTGLFRCLCEVRGERRSEPAGWRLGWPSRVERIQRREHVRVSVRLRAEVRFRAEDRPRQIAGTTADLSAGGVRVRLPEPIPPGTAVEVALDVPRIGPRDYDAVVTRSEPEEDGAATGRHGVGFRFEDLPDAVGRRIVQYVFSVQREQMRRAAR
jgi:c-di-GMP-binding flagellar brake protein YcgR